MKTLTKQVRQCNLTLFEFPLFYSLPAVQSGPRVRGRNACLMTQIVSSLRRSAELISVRYKALMGSSIFGEKAALLAPSSVLFPFALLGSSFIALFKYVFAMANSLLSKRLRARVFGLSFSKYEGKANFLRAEGMMTLSIGAIGVFRDTNGFSEVKVNLINQLALPPATCKFHQKECYRTQQEWKPEAASHSRNVFPIKGYSLGCVKNGGHENGNCDQQLGASMKKNMDKNILHDISTVVLGQDPRGVRAPGNPLLAMIQSHQAMSWQGDNACR